MTLPSLDYQRGRETGVQAERWFWASRLEALARELRSHGHDLAVLSAASNTNAQAAAQQMQVWADQLFTLIQDRIA